MTFEATSNTVKHQPFRQWFLPYVESSLIKNFYGEILSIVIPHGKMKTPRAAENIQKVNRPRVAGFTLLELLVTVAIAAILVSLAVPSFRTMLLNSQMQARVSALISSANQARLTAIRNGVSATLCPGDGTSVTCGTNWSIGWQVVSSGPSVIGAAAFPAGGPSVTTTGGNALISFLSNGVVTNWDTFLICDTRGHSYATQVNILASGYIQSSSQGYDTAGVPIASSAACP